MDVAVLEVFKMPTSSNKFVLCLSSSELTFHWIYCCLKITLCGATNTQHWHWTLKCMVSFFFGMLAQDKSAWSFRGCLQNIFFPCGVENHESSPAPTAGGWHYIWWTGQLNNCSDNTCLSLHCTCLSRCFEASELVETSGGWSDVLHAHVHWDVKRF